MRGGGRGAGDLITTRASNARVKKKESFGNFNPFDAVVTFDPFRHLLAVLTIMAPACTSATVTLAGLGKAEKSVNDAKVVK